MAQSAGERQFGAAHAGGADTAAGATSVRGPGSGKQSDPGGTGAKLAAIAQMASQHGLWDQAITALEQACRFSPDDADVLLDLGYAYHFRRRHQDALDVYSKIVQLRPKWPSVYANLGGLLVGMGRMELAIAASKICIQLDPDLAGAYVNLAAALRAEDRQDEACLAYQALLERHPQNAAGLVDYFHLRQHLCDWNGIDDHLAQVIAHTYRKGHRAPPFSIVVGSADPEEHLRAGRTWTARWAGGMVHPVAPYAPRTAEQRARRIRIGYLSNDFYNHATALLLIELLELRDRDAFEVFGYSTGGLDDGTLIRHRIISAFDICYDIKDLNDHDAARKIREDDIDILIDLKGFTAGARTEILSLRAAPIQVNYLGYPGTMGAKFIDYIIADPFIVPRGSERYFDEQVVRLPDCYQPNDRKRPIAEDSVTRADCGLREDSFVFCSFNAPYKITPEIFDLWMRLLDQTPNSVLWVLEGHKICNDNLRKEAVRRGMPEERIVFAPKLDTSHHLARMRLGDLFLDTFPVNAHTTASDALWVGLPVVTCAGEAMVSRVAGSLLQAVGLPDLVTNSLAEYESKVLELVQNPDLLRNVRDRLQTNRLTMPLFDSHRYTRHYEAALLEMAALRDAGIAPRTIDVPALP